MDTVTESHMAVSMAALGGIVILHSNAASSDLAAMVRSVKARRVPLLSAPVFMSRGDRIHNNDVFDHSANPYVLVTESGTPSSKLLGYMASRDWVKLANKEVKIYDYMVSCKDMVLPWSSDLGKIKEFMADKGRDVAATVRDDEVVDVVGKEDVESINELDLRFFRFTGAESINEAFVLAAHISFAVQRSTFFGSSYGFTGTWKEALEWVSGGWMKILGILDTSESESPLTPIFRFIMGFFLGGVPWYIGTFILLCVRVDYREKPGYVACTLASIIAVLAITLGVTK